MIRKSPFGKHFQQVANQISDLHRKGNLSPEENAEYSQALINRHRWLWGKGVEIEKLTTHCKHWILDELIKDGSRVELEDLLDCCEKKSTVVNPV